MAAVSPSKARSGALLGGEDLQAGGPPAGEDRLHELFGQRLGAHLGGEPFALVLDAAELDLDARRPPDRLLLRFRHPRNRAILSVQVNGKDHSAFDAEAGDVDLTGRSGTVRVVARYAPGECRK